MREKFYIKIIRLILLSIFLIFSVFPLVWIFLTSIKPADEVYTFPVRYFPREPTLEAYRYLFSFANFGVYFKNSVMVSMTASIVSTYFALLSGYVLARKKFKFKKLLILALFFAQMIPSYLIMIPQYSMFSKLGLIDKLTGITIVYMGIGASFSTIMARGFFLRIPRSLEEAAMIDGCSEVSALFRITVPLMLPGISAVFSFSFVNTWNELFTAVLFLNSDRKMTVPVALYSFISKAGIKWNVLSAGLVVALLPTMLVFAFAQRFIIQGLTQGSVKEV
ncbi:MAG: carbohydrate ABC transporter permease [Thermotoga sp.]|nr:MAG: carbohydrate ABC transporter permease [Thermotoga sp.]